ncbi:MAG: biopolymer transporter ExbD [Nitrospirae bacterium]|nr:biopolymer transporter ExbD [Nitrospirota bacterium]
MDFKRRRHNHVHLNIAPLVDVVFLLLLFFMLTSHLIQEPAIKIKLPESKTSETQNEHLSTIYITKNADIYFMDKRVDIENLQRAIKESTSEGKKEFIRIKVDREANVGLLVRVIDEVKIADITNFSIVTEKGYSEK